MWSNLTRFLKKYKKAILVVSILPGISLFLCLYSYFFVFHQNRSIGEVRSPLASRFYNPDIIGASVSAGLKQATAEASNAPALKSTGSDQPTPTPKPTAEAAAGPALAAPVASVARSRRINFPVNKFGVYIFDNEDDLNLAAQLVNSNGGDWGWVLIPIDIHERNVDKWNRLFSVMLDKHLIPILQLISSNKSIPSDDDIDGTAKFLGGLGWPTKLRFVSVYNEVNASEYWGGKIDPVGYAHILNRVIDSFKAQSQEFFIMNGAFNASAQTGSLVDHCITTDLGVYSCYRSELVYLQQMNAAVPGIFSKLDGWASHTYPFPGYVGPPRIRQYGAESGIEIGRNSIASYQFELRLLAQYGASNLPVFITETGWPHKEGQTTHPEWLDANTVASYYQQAFQNVFLPDSHVVAVTPFILEYGNYDNFAFVSASGEKFPQWNAVAGIPKTTGAPPINK